MTTQDTNTPGGCSQCRDGNALDFDFSMAFQPIIDMQSMSVFAQEALVRGAGDESAGNVFAHVNDDNRYAFDQACRVKAIALAARLGMTCMLSINFMPGAVYQPARCIQATLKAAREHNFPIEQIMFEVTEGERVDDVAHLQNILSHYRHRGFTTALDDFGAGYSGLNLLAELDVGLIKIDMGLIRDVDSNRKKHAIVSGITGACSKMNIRVIAEGVETRAEFDTLRNIGINLYQGFYFAKAAYEAEAELDWDRIAA